MDSGIAGPWDLTVQSARHALKLKYVSQVCKLAPEEELQV